MFIVVNHTAQCMKRPLEINPFLLHAVDEALQSNVPIIHDEKRSAFVRPSELVLKQKIVFEPVLVPKIAEAKQKKRGYTSFGLYKCAQCIFRTTHQTRLDNHKKIHAMMKEAPALKVCRCEERMCGFLTLERRTLENHTSSHLDQKLYQCPVEGCFGKTKSERSMKRHIKTHHPGAV